MRKIYNLTMRQYDVAQSPEHSVELFSLYVTEAKLLESIGRMRQHMEKLGAMGEWNTMVLPFDSMISAWSLTKECVGTTFVTIAHVSKITVLE